MRSASPGKESCTSSCLQKSKTGLGDAKNNCVFVVHVCMCVCVWPLAYVRSCSGVMLMSASPMCGPAIHTSRSTKWGYIPATTQQTIAPLEHRCMHTHTHTCLKTYKYTSTVPHTYKHAHTQTHTYEHTHTCTSTHARTLSAHQLHAFCYLSRY